jgi:phage repressor protein C with HTH and peptisase S24 domain
MTDFQEFIKTNKLKQKQVAEYLDTSPQYISQVAKGLCSLSDEKYEKLVQGSWDISMLNIPPYIKVPSTLTVYNPSSEERQEIGSSSIDMSIVPAEVVEEIKAEVVEEMIVPIVPHEVALKAETNIKKYIEDNASELEHFDPRSVTAEVDTAERICTNSMYPTFLPGDVIFIQFLQEKSKITDGGIYYFDTSTRPTMIRLVKLLDDGRLLLKAFNPRYGDIYMRKEEITNIGKISGMYRQTFSDMYAEIEEVRRKKDEQVDNLIKQNSEALNIIKDLIKKG